jgi:hypothetical protein
MMRSSVVLPDPFGPRTPRRAPGVSRTSRFEKSGVFVRPRPDQRRFVFRCEAVKSISALNDIERERLSSSSSIRRSAF